MSNMDDKQQETESGGAARRTYASLLNTRGFMWEATGMNGGDMVVSICPMDVRSYWRHVGTGKSTAKDALYEQVTP